MKPTVSRVVHYVSAGSADGTYPSVCRAAVVTEVCDNPGGVDPETGTLCVSLAVLNPEGIHFNQHRPQDELAHTPQSWHWPMTCPGLNDQ